MVAAHKQIEHSAYRFGQSVDKGDRLIVGVNKFVGNEAPNVDLCEVPETTMQRKLESLQLVRERRDRWQLVSSLEDVRHGSQGTDNLMPPILEAVQAYATVGEICIALGSVFGDYTETT